MKIKPIKGSEFRAEMKSHLGKHLSPTVVLALMRFREVEAYIVHPETFVSRMTDLDVFSCPHCDAGIIVPPTMFDTRLRLKPQVKLANCVSCGGEVRVVKDIRPHIYVAADSPEGD